MHRLSSLILYTVTLWSCLFTRHTSSGLSCAICQHTGLSMVAPNAPNSRFVFDAATDNCLEEAIECAPSENFCLASVALVSGDRFWIQKGCIAAKSDNELDPEEPHGFANGSGCVRQILDDAQIRNMPVDTGFITSLETTVCLCNLDDYCNSGPVTQLESIHGYNAAATDSRGLGVIVILWSLCAWMYGLQS